MMEGTIWLRARRIDFAIVISDSSTYLPLYFRTIFILCTTRFSLFFHLSEDKKMILNVDRVK